MSQNKRRTRNNVRFITIERLENGFLIVCPDMGQGENSFKKCSHTLNGVISFMEKAWNMKKIEDKDREITNETLVFTDEKQTKPRVFKNADHSTDKN